jgi:hypothetical protein
MRTEQRAALLADLRAVVRSSTQAGELEYGVLTGDPERWENCILTVIHAPDDGRPVAFNALTIMECTLRGRPVEVLHLGLVMIDPGFRAQGLSGVLYGLTCFLLFARGQMRPLWISNVTQVPAVFGMVAENFSGVFPSPVRAGRRSFDQLALAREIMGRHRGVFGVGAEAGFDEGRFVITDSYTGGSDNLKKPFEAAPSTGARNTTRPASTGSTTPAATTSCRSDSSTWLRRAGTCCGRRHGSRSARWQGVLSASSSRPACCLSCTGSRPRGLWES